MDTQVPCGNCICSVRNLGPDLAAAGGIRDLEDAFFDGRRQWNKENKEEVANRLAERLSREGRRVAREGNAFVALSGLPEDPTHELELQTSGPVVSAEQVRVALADLAQTRGALVDAVYSVVRRSSILKEIGPAASRPLDHSQLRDYLKEIANVPDYDQVTESFDPAFKTEVVTFDKPTKLWRLYGGTSNAEGRYFFCCSWTEGAARWIDAGGLATPRANLRDRLAEVTIPERTTAIIGIVADNFLDQMGHFERGGNTQIFMPPLGTFPRQEFRLAGDKGDVFEIAVHLEDRTLRFRP